MKFEKAEREIIQNTLMRIHDRRMRYLYTGMFDQDDVLVLGTHREDEFKFGNPEQSIALMNITHEETKDLIIKFLSLFGVTVNKLPMLVVGLADLVSFSNKLKWDLSTTTLREDDNGAITAVSGEHSVDVAIPVDSHYTYVRLCSQISILRDALLGDKHEMIYIPLDPDDVVPIRRIILNPDVFVKTSLEKMVKYPLKFLISRGRDLLTPKKLIEKSEAGSYTYGLHVWSPSGAEFCYAGYFRNENFTVLSGRLNMFILQPRKR